MLLRWDRQGTDTATPTPTFIEITLTPTGDGTIVRVQFSGLSAEDAAFYSQLWARHLDRLALPWLAPNPRMATESGTASSEVNPQVHYWSRGRAGADAIKGRPLTAKGRATLRRIVETAGLRLLLHLSARRRSAHERARSWAFAHAVSPPLGF